MCRYHFSGLEPTRYPLRTRFSQRLERLLILAQPRLMLSGRKTAARTGAASSAASSLELTISAVLLFFTVRMEAAVGATENKKYFW